MKRSSTKKVGKYIIPMLSAGLTISLLQNHGLREELTDIPLHNPEQHWEEHFFNDYRGLNLDQGIASATGTSSVLAFHGQNSNENSLKWPIQ